MKKKDIRYTRNNPPAKGNEDMMTVMMASELLGRAMLGSYLGKSFGTDRDLYLALGYPRVLGYAQYAARYERQEIASRIVDAYPSACWRLKPEISENAVEETAFEKAWKELEKRHKIFHYLCRTDKLSGVGRYGVLLLGLSDSADLSTPVQRRNGLRLLYLRPFTEGGAQVDTWVRDERDERFGMPEVYKLSVETPVGASGSSMTSKELRVHWTRVLHVAEGKTTNDFEGTPRLRPVYNRLQDLEILAGGSAEMFWRGAYPGMGFIADADARFDPGVLDTMKTDIEEYLHGLKRYLRLQGVKIDQLEPQIADPSKHVDIQLQLISAQTCIPKRILIGSERGELASTQDETAWNNKVDERREDYVAPWMVRPLIDRLTEFGVLPEHGDYDVNWPPLAVPDEKTAAEIVKTKAEALAAYVNAAGADAVIPPRIFLRDFLDMSEEAIEEIEEELEDYMEKEKERIAEEQEQFELEQRRMEAEGGGQQQGGQPQQRGRGGAV